MNKQKSYYPKAVDISHEWVLIDADGLVLGRLATEIARRVRGKHRANFTPGVDQGDFVVVINADKVRVTGQKTTDKLYHRYTGFSGGVRTQRFSEVLAKHPTRLVQLAVRGMLRQNRLRKNLLAKVKIYAGDQHPHGAQNPKPVTIRA
ncbi:MAG: 50S ribosomal protein L13 [Candidatus Margulisiibacteriota bacterium]